MVTLGSGRSHDSSIGNGGTMISHNSPGQAGSHADDQKMIRTGKHRSCGRVCKHTCHNRDQDTEGAPAGAGGEGQTDRDEEDDRREHGEQAVSRALNETRNVHISAEKAGHVLECERESEDEQRGNHRDEALGDAAGSILEGDDAAQEQDCSGYCVAGPITDNRDGTLSIKMGSYTQLEQALRELEEALA